MTPIHITPELALRLEGVEAANAWSAIRRIAEVWPEARAESLAICGGQAGFTGQGSFLSQMLHLGLAGPVSRDDWNRMERFFRERETAAVISLCPYADASVHEWLAMRNYRISHFENTLVCRLDDPVPEPAIATGIVSDPGAWARRVIEGFGLETPDESFVRLVAALGTSENATALEIRIDGEIASCGIVGIVGSTAILNCDSTLERFRGRGLQTALIRERLRRARAAGCDLAMACTVPGTVSQRNYERAGFQVAYTKPMLVKDWN